MENSKFSTNPRSADAGTSRGLPASSVRLLILGQTAMLAHLVCYVEGPSSVLRALLSAGASRWENAMPIRIAVAVESSGGREWN
jgi:hypothetical protein